MKKVVVFGLAVLVFTCCALAKEGKGKDKDKEKAKDPNSQISQAVLTGKVVVSKNSAGEIAAVKVVDAKKDKTYNIVLDEKGRKLAELDGKKVNFRGKAEMIDGQQWITVRHFTQVQRKTGQDTDKPKEKQKEKGKKYGIF